MNEFETKPHSHVLHIMTSDACLLTQQVSRHANVSEERALTLIQMGAVYLEKRRVTEDRPVKPGSYLRIHSKPRRYSVEGIVWRERVLGESRDWVVIDKPAGLPVPATVDNLFENVTYQLSSHLGVPLFVTQRLDRPTSGVLVLAKSKEFQREFNRLLSERKVKKVYSAFTKKYVEPKQYRHFIEDSKRVPKSVRDEGGPGFLLAELHTIQCTKHPSDLFQSEIELLTGRTHQIRAQYAYLGCPLVGDTPYGGEELMDYNENRIGLRALSVSFLEKTFHI